MAIKPIKKLSLKSKTTIMIAMIVFTVSVVSVMLCEQITWSVLKTTYETRTIDLSRAIASTIDTDALCSVRDDVMRVFIDTRNRVENADDPGYDDYIALFADVERTEQFRSVRAQLQAIQSKTQVNDLYIVYPYRASGSMIYLVDAAEDEKYYPPGSFEPLDGNPYMTFQDTRAGFLPHVTNSDEYGWLVAAAMPIRDRAGIIVGYAGVDYSMNEIMAEKTAYVKNFTGMVVMLALVLTLASAILVDRSVIRPINQLADAARRYRMREDNGVDYDFAESIPRTGDEIEYLADSMVQMERDINEHIADLLSTREELSNIRDYAEEMNKEANWDVHTGVRNKRAYAQEEDKLNRRIANGIARFGVLMIDMNGLKSINDTFGHDKGDMAIRRLCTIVCETFKHSPVFRMGGDEFTVVLSGRDYRESDRLIAAFESDMAERLADDAMEPWEKASAAIGYARYDAHEDRTVSDVFHRADKTMYECKIRMKQGR